MQLTIIAVRLALLMAIALVGHACVSKVSADRMKPAEASSALREIADKYRRLTP